MKKIIIIIFIFVLFINNLVFGIDNNKLDGYKYLIPAYWWSFKYNNDLLNIENAVIILNPNNGEFTNSEPIFNDLVERAKVNNNLVIGYVYTGYGKRNILDIKRDIDNYLKYYKVDGIFLDEAANSKDKLDFYKNIYNYIKSKNKNLLVFLNPGITPDKGYLEISDNIVIYENSCSNYDNFFPPIWLNNYSSNKFSFLGLECSKEQNEKLTKKYNKFLTYFTEDGKDGNPWDTLSIYYVNREKKDNTQQLESKKIDTLKVENNINNKSLESLEENIKQKNKIYNNKEKNLLYIIGLLLVVIIILLIKKR